MHVLIDNEFIKYSNLIEEILPKKSFEKTFFVGTEITTSEIKSADAILCRSVTKLNQEFLKDSQISVIASATSGTDHISDDLINSKNYQTFFSSGANAWSVVHYVMAVIETLIAKELFSSQKSVGIIGHGNIGKRLGKTLSAFNIPWHANDPFLEDKNLVDLETIFNCDLISIHTPFTREGEHPTYKLINKNNIKSLTNKIIINTSRGGIVDEKTLLQGESILYISDVWENEPKVNELALKHAYISTPHIAGHSLDGKKGSLIEACKFIRTAKSLDKIEYSHSALEASKIITFDTFLNNFHAHDFPLGMFTSEFPINEISDEFKQACGKNFLQLRSNHPQRRDFINFNFNDFLNRDASIDKFINNLVRLRG